MALLSTKEKCGFDFILGESKSSCNILLEAAWSLEDSVVELRLRPRLRKTCSPHAKATSSGTGSPPSHIPLPALPDMLSLASHGTS